MLCTMSCPFRFPTPPPPTPFTADLADQVVGGVTKIQAEHCPDCRTVYVTGHSLGAAIAGINAIELATNGSLAANTTVRLLNFGMPRVGNKDFSDAFRHYVPFSQRMVHHRGSPFVVEGVEGGRERNANSTPQSFPRHCPAPAASNSGLLSHPHRDLGEVWEWAWPNTTKL